MKATPGWTRVVAACAAEQAELVADGLWGFGPAAIEEQSGGPRTVLSAGFDDADIAGQAAAVARSLGAHPVLVTAVTDDGLDGWREWATVERAGPFVLVPAWLDAPEVAPDETVLRLEPGRTFGSGSHPTTRAVLTLLPSRVGSTTTVLDVGCGSGVLAVAAATLGAPSVHGVDVDPESPAVVAVNATTNQVADVVTASNEPLSVVAQKRSRFDLVLANLLAPVITELAAELQEVVADGGTLVLSGLLADRWHQTIDDFTTHPPPDCSPWAVDEVMHLDGWVAVALRRR